MTGERVSWETYFLNIARQAATRSTCPRKAVGAVIVRDRTILSTGYNGAVRGLPHCTDEGCEMKDGHCIRTVHAEANAIIQAACNGISVKDSDIYTTSQPCWSCFKLIANAGIKTIYYDEPFPDEQVARHADSTGIRMVRLK